MPLAIATESSHLSLSLFLSLSSYPHNLFPSVCTHMCSSASLFSVSSTLYLLLRPLSSFPSSRPPCEPTERRFNPSPIVKINGFSRSFLYAASPLRFQKRTESMRRCNAAAPFYFRTHENRRLCFWPLLGDDARRYVFYLFVAACRAYDLCAYLV